MKHHADFSRPTISKANIGSGKETSTTAKTEILKERALLRHSDHIKHNGFSCIRWKAVKNGKTMRIFRLIRDNKLYNAKVFVILNQQYIN